MQKYNDEARKPGSDAKTGDKPDASAFPVPDPAEFGRNLMMALSQSQRLVTEFLARNKDPRDLAPIDPMNVAGALMELGTRLIGNPKQALDAHFRLWKDYWSLWESTVRRLSGEEVEPVIKPLPGDKRFKAAEWQEYAVFDFIKQSYLLTSRWLHNTVQEVDGLDAKTRKKLDFFTKQFADAISPSNFALTNPEVLKETLRSNGENLVRGLGNLLEDLERGKGKLTIAQTDFDKFEIGRNIALSPGKVVFQNELMQLIQYMPATDEVYERPLLIFPPWINKYYILDLRPENSFVRWMTQQGYTVFVASWVNPDKRLAEKTFEDYMNEGIYAAIDAVEKATGVKDPNTIGYCIGGTLLGATLAHMAAHKRNRVQSATFFAAQIDFTEAGDLQVFIDEEQLERLEQQMQEAGGYLEGSAMAQTFNMLRSNDLIWSFVVNNYLMGREPVPFDLLYWNADATRMPHRMHLFYLRECYMRNSLAKGEMVLGDTKLDLSKVKVPIFLQSSRDDHIAPMASVYKATKLFGGPVNFIVAGSGHIAGVINHPAAKKYQHWTNAHMPATLDQWWKSAKETPGSWWPMWEEWLRERSGEKVKARVPGDLGLSVVEDAPGSYVKMK
ncbi:MAG: class I poly(R)-hydroxyalkanoic acid synthase [Alphaproteobacteria bacterium]|nr:class I poly(R)-hydroxyalkanoic acid synthase [Alphaproteobacteria bacterium]